MKGGGIVICEHCKERPATITVTQIQNTAKQERHYCEVCAAKFHPLQFDLQEEPISIHQLMSNWFGAPIKSSYPEGTKKSKHIVDCPKCGMTYRHFLKIGKFGCPSCYDAFREQLPPVLKRLQADVKHVGKMQQAEQQIEHYQQQLESMRKELRQAIEEERFEDAAKLRDEARAIEKKLSVGGVDTP